MLIFSFAKLATDAGRRAPRLSTPDIERLVEVLDQLGDVARLRATEVYSLCNVGVTFSAEPGALRAGI